MKYTQEVDWSNAIVTTGDHGEIIEVPFTVQSGLKTKVGEQNYLSYHRLLLKKSVDGFTYNHVQILTKNEYFDNTDKLFNFYQITDDFDGIVLVVNQKNEAVQFSSFKNSLLLKPSITGKMATTTCIYMGWEYENGDFRAIALVGCFGGGGDSNDNGGYPPHVGGGGGGSGGGSASTILINIEGEKVDPKVETQCFDKSKPAVLTIYVQQPNENTRDKMGANSVGHTFIGIQQGGIQRILGFYPDSPNASLISSQNSELHDNSNTLYHISISVEIDAIELANVINYVNNYPKTYDLNNYNCSDFAIGAATNGGLNLPKTKGSYDAVIVNFKGHNPGDLGEDIRKMNTPSGATKSTTKGNAPKKKGGC
nr:hypothetical protein [uncultured Flavobacterium sp.]